MGRTMVYHMNCTHMTIKKYEHYKKRSEIHYQVDDKDYKKTSDIEKLNKELRQYVDSLFNEEMEKIIKEQCDS